MSLDEKKATACLTLYLFVLSQMVLQLWLRFLQEATIAVKRKATSKQKGAVNTKERAKKTGETKQMLWLESRHLPGGSD